MKKKILGLCLAGAILLNTGCVYGIPDYVGAVVEETVDEIVQDNVGSSFTRTRKIEIYNLEEGEELIRTITDRSDINEFVDTFYRCEEIDMDSLPKGVKPLYRLDFWQNTTKQLLNPRTELYRVSQETLYQDEDGNYYLYTDIANDYMTWEMVEYTKMVSHISSEAADIILYAAEGY